MSGATRLNAMPGPEARAALLCCCGSRRWVERMMAARPFASADEVRSAADAIWRDLERGDVLEAFADHPRIGGDDLDDARFARTRSMSRAEQSGVETAGAGVRERLRRGNDDYAERFGHVFLVFASGRTASDMLDELERRLGNDPETELAVAAEEQRLIMQSRLGKMLA